MPNWFVSNGNESLFHTKEANTPESSLVEGHTEEVVKDEEWFKKQLQERGVASFEIDWGDYKSNFQEIPAHLLERYLRYRPSLFHAKALETILLEEKLMEAHPFAQ